MTDSLLATNTYTNCLSAMLSKDSWNVRRSIIIHVHLLEDYSIKIFTIQLSAQNETNYTGCIFSKIEKYLKIKNH